MGSHSYDSRVNRNEGTANTVPRPGYYPTIRKEST